MGRRVWGCERSWDVQTRVKPAEVRRGGTPVCAPAPIPQTLGADLGGLPKF